MAKKAMAKKAPSAAAVQKELDNEVAAIAGSISAPSGNKIRTNEKVFKFPDGSVETGPVDFVILDYTSQNRFYKGAWDPNNPAGPECFAIGKVINDMAPSANSPDKQADNCHSCPMNQFGSDGNGKACKNTRLLAVMRADEDPAEGEIYTISVSPTGLKGFDGFVAGVANNFQAPPIKVVVPIDFDTSVPYAKLTFGAPQPNKDFAKHYARRAEAEPMLNVEPDVSNNPPAKKKRGRG